MKNLILILSSLICGNAVACQYGIGWTRTAEGLVKHAYGDEAKNLNVGEINDKSFYLFTRPNGVNCPDQIRAVTNVSFTYLEKSCVAKIILKARYDDARLARVRCH